MKRIDIEPIGRFGHIIKLDGRNADSVEIRRVLDPDRDDPEEVVVDGRVLSGPVEVWVDDVIFFRRGRVAGKDRYHSV